MKPASLLTRLRRPDGRRFVAFLLTGGLAALCNIASRIAFDIGLKAVVMKPFASYEIAVVVAYLVGMTVAFALAKVFVFQSSGRSLHVEYGRFALVNAVALVQVWLVSVALLRGVFPFFDFTWHAETLSHVIGVLSPVLVSYQGHKRFSFR